MLEKQYKLSEFSAEGPYPEIKVAGPNDYYAFLLLSDYSGLVSEMTAINQYLYHHLWFEEGNKDEIADLLKGISIVEMHHLEMLAEMIILLGGDPKYIGGLSENFSFWCADYVYYGCGLVDRLEADIQAEQNAIKNYSEHIAIIKDPYIQAVLRRIIKDERHHLRLFEEALKKYVGNS